MKGIGGPLLCIGDLLSDVGEGDSEDHHNHIKVDSPLSPSSSSSSTAPSSSLPNSNLNLQPSHLSNIFQHGYFEKYAVPVPGTYRRTVPRMENYDHLNEALAGTDHSWTALTLKLCTALETANKLVQSTNSHVGLLSEKVGELESVIKRGDSAIAAAKTIHNSLNR
ncbi:hypothetical protein TEA_003693 [Camellia sinensis var. sinensis]|uniref:Uncharacterized protein n=1 Tax=Camellia sinensis var. sinensis TaxID=542762 RepID=A0A4S4DV44_CAMSN|nr:hypothetical protein TEA_003693 [Camellia sinensis var. sinensis]